MKEKIGNFISRFIMLLFSLTVLFPLGWIVIKSLQTNQEFLPALGDGRKWRSGRTMPRLGTACISAIL